MAKFTMPHEPIELHIGFYLVIRGEKMNHEEAYAYAEWVRDDRIPLYERALKLLKTLPDVELVRVTIESFEECLTVSRRILELAHVNIN